MARYLSMVIGPRKLGGTMAFVCTWREESLSDIAYFLDRDSPFVTAPVGYDDKERTSYSVLVGLTKTGGSITEYYFQLHKYIEDTDSIETILSGQQLANYLTRDDKKKIMDVILLLTDLLLTRTNEREIYRCTFYIYPPPKAL
jgi:hypothetical protein